ncbi:MAG: hypothetical protein V1799_06985 [bacterium]
MDTWLDVPPEFQYDNGKYIIDLEVMNDAGLNLRFIASKADTPIATIRAAYLFNNRRIRGIDWHVARFAAQGGRINGWHEHIWHDQYGDNYIVGEGNIEHIPPSQQISYILNKWNIRFPEQLSLGLNNE